MDAIKNAKDGNLEYFKKAEPEILLNAKDTNGDTVLSIVVKGNYVDCCKEICKRCPSLLCSFDSKGYPPLHAAAFFGYLDILKILISTCNEADLENQHDIEDQGGDRADRQKTLKLSSTTRDGFNAMHMAVYGGKLDCIKLLIEADPNKELLRAGDNYNYTPLHRAVVVHRAVDANMLDIARLLIEVDPDFLYGANSSGEFPLFFLVHKIPLLIAIDQEQELDCRYGENMRRLILELQPTQSMMRVNENGWTALHYCVSLGNYRAIEDILRYCPESSKVADKEGQNFFHHAVNKLGNEKMVEEILRMKEITEEVLNCTDNSGRTPFEVAAESQNESMILCLHKDHRVNKKLTVTKKLNWVVKKHNIVILELFMREIDDFLMNIEEEVFLNSKNEEDETILFKAAQEGKPILCEKLCKRCPSLIYHQSRGGHTALHRAVETNQLEIARLLIEAEPAFAYGANLEGKTPLLIAIDKQAELHNDGEMIKLILELQPTQSMVSVNEKGWTALHYCVSRGYSLSIEYIIQSCPESSKVADNEVQNFFQFAVKLGNEEMVRHILEMKEITDEVLNSTDNSGRTPFEVAAESQNESMILCLHKDHRVNKKLTVTQKLNWVVEKHNIVILELFMREIDDFLMNIEEEVFLNSKNEEDETILFKAAKKGETVLCAKLCERCPSLIYHQSKSRSTALHLAAWREKLEILKILIEVDEKIPQKKLLTMVDDQGDTAFHKAVLNHELEAVKLLLEADPDCEYVANNSGVTPIMISIREARSNENNFDSTGEIRKLLFQMQPRQTMAHSWENGGTLLHKATYEEDLSCIQDIIKFCTGNLDVVDNNGKNFLHIAAELEKIEVVRLVLRDKDIPKGVLDKKDKDGNTPFHIAALTGNEPLTRCFLFDRRVDKNTVNNDKQHVLREIKFPYDKRKARVLGLIVEQSDLDRSDFDLVVGALIATVSFAAGITVPGGYISDGPNQGTALFSKRVSFASFTISNTLALVFSLFAMFCHFCARNLISWDADIICLLIVAKCCTLAAMCCMLAAFIAGSFAILANSNWLAIVVCIISCLFFIFGCGPLWMWKTGRRSKRPASELILNWFKKFFGWEGGNALVE